MLKVQASKLKETLWETLENLRGNNIEVDEAVAIAGLAKAIVNVTSIQLKIAVHANNEIPSDLVEFSKS